jgi:general secretion pathway protein J
MHKQSGFTLLELLVAITIFAVVSAVSYGTLIRVIDQDEHLEQERKYWQRLASALLRLEDDLAYVVPRRVRNNNGIFTVAFFGQPVDSRAVSPPSLEFTRTGQWILETSRTPGMQHVAYRVKDNELLREVWPSLDRAPTDRPRSTVLVSGIEQFDLRFLSADGKWLNRWPATDGGDTVPIGVELVLKTVGRPSVRRVYIVNG